LLEKLRDGDFGTINQAQNELIQELLHSRQYERHLVDNILSVYSEKADNFSDSFQLTDMNQLLSEQIIPIFQYMAESKNIALKVTLAKDLPKVNVIPHDIQRVFNNLLYNAFTYTNSKGEVTVESRANGNGVLFIIKDTGIGIASEYLGELFHQCEPTNNRFKPGAGLGLYLSKKIIDVHGGKIWVETQLGEGSQFFMTLPLLHSV
jgi:signal transduction histidine kinase